jgi:SPFH domain / Band 7 family
MFGGSDIFVLIVVFLAILTVFLGVKTVPQGYNWTVERFGRYTRMLRPGLNLVVPFIDRIGRKMNVMEQVIDVPEQEVITKDNASVAVDGTAFFKVFDAAKASYEISSLEPAILKLTTTNIRSVMGTMDLDEVLSHRDEITNVCCASSTPPYRPGASRSTALNQGHRAARRSHSVDGPANEGRAQQARRNIDSGRPAAVRDPQGGGRQTGPNTGSRGPPRGRLP